MMCQPGQVNLKDLEINYLKRYMKCIIMNIQIFIHIHFDLMHKINDFDLNVKHLNQASSHSLKGTTD